MEIITLNMVPKGITPVCHASQFDDGRVIRLNIVDELHGYIFTDEEVELRVRKPDDNVVTASVAVVSGNAYVDIVTTEQMTACEGDNECELRLTKGEQRIGSLNFKMRVEKDPLKDGIESETEIHNLETQIADINAELVPGLVADEVANQYDSSNVIFDDEPTEGHDEGYAVKSGGLKAYIPKNIDELDDVEINNPQANQAIVYNPITHKFENGEVSTVGSIDDLDDVDTTGKAEGDDLRYDGNGWVAKPNTVTMTLAEWNAMSTSEQTEWLNSHKKTRLILSDAPNLNATAKQISYDGGTDTVWDKVESLFYDAGDEISCVNMLGYGFVGYSKSSIRFLIPLSKPIKATSATLSGGWTIATTAGNAYVDTVLSTIGTVNTQIMPNGIYVEVALSNPIASATDNTPIYVYGRSAAKIIFS